MSTQIYLLLIRNSEKNWLDTAAKKSKLAYAAWVPLLLKEMVMGDSFDVPFLKFIRVQSVSHGIKMDSSSAPAPTLAGSLDGSSYSRAASHGGESRQVEKTRLADAQSLAGKRLGGSADAYQSYLHAREAVKSQKEKEGLLKGNDFSNVTLPAHDDFTFTKLIDCATPQLSYGCSAQEPFPFAFFFFRRKVGMGAGAPAPFYVCALYKSLISGWSLGGDCVETVTLKYQNIAWFATDTYADTSLPGGIPISTRWFNPEAKKGGETGWSMVLPVLVGALTAAHQAAT